MYFDDQVTKSASEDLSGRCIEMSDYRLSPESQPPSSSSIREGVRKKRDKSGLLPNFTKFQAILKIIEMTHYHSNHLANISDTLKKRRGW